MVRTAGMRGMARTVCIVRWKYSSAGECEDGLVGAGRGIGEA